VGEAKAVIEAMKARGAEVPIPTDVVVAKTLPPTHPRPSRRRGMSRPTT